jgi:ureidoacrylate peracid hydrolase
MYDVQLVSSVHRLIVHGEIVKIRHVCFAPAGTLAAMEIKTNQQRRRILAGMAAVPLIGIGVAASGRKLKLEANPGSIALDRAKTAVLAIDMQNDFASKGGMFDLAGIDISGIRKAIAPTANVLAAARQAALPIIYLKMGFRPDLSDLGAPDSPNRVRHLQMRVGQNIRAPDGRDSRILIRDTWNTDILAELRPETTDIVMYKHRFSGFFETALDSTLKRQGIKYLVVTGCTTSVCVEATVRDAMFRDYSCVLLTDCMSQPTLPNSQPGSNHQASLVVTEAFFGWTSSSEQFTAAALAHPG